MPYWFDGNNLIGKSVEAVKADPRISQAFISALSAYRKSGGGKFLVYFDGDDRNRIKTPPGVSVRYSAPVSADEAIVSRLREIKRPEEVIVVTNDRALQNRCRNAGAKAMDWRQFTEKMRSRAISRRRGQDLHEKVDVDDWMRYFGLDESDI